MNAFPYGGEVHHGGRTIRSYCVGSQEAKWGQKVEWACKISKPTLLPSSSRKITSWPVSSCEASVGVHEPVGVILQSNYVRDISIENFFLQSLC